MEHTPLEKRVLEGAGFENDDDDCFCRFPEGYGDGLDREEQISKEDGNWVCIVTHINGKGDVWYDEASDPFEDVNDAVAWMNKNAKEAPKKEKKKKK